MALNDRSLKMWPQIRILSSMKCWDLGIEQLVFLLYNFINKVHANIDTELCTCAPTQEFAYLFIWHRVWFIFDALHCMFSFATCSFSLIKKGDCTGHAYSTTGLTSDFMIKLSEDFSVLLLHVTASASVGPAFVILVHWHIQVNWRGWISLHNDT